MFLELGLPGAAAGLDLVTRFVYGSPNTPAPIASYYAELIPKVLNDPEFHAWAESAKRPLQVAGPEKVAASVKGWVDTYGKYDAQIKAGRAALGGEGYPRDLPLPVEGSAIINSLKRRHR